MSEKKFNLKVLNVFHLKVIAAISMTIDHIGAVLLPQYYFLRIIGRLAFPIYCFLMVNGFLHTRNIKKYIGRLAVFAVISEVFFDKTFFGEFYNPLNQNVFLTLLIGMLMLAAIEFLRSHSIVKLKLISYILEGVVVILACGLAYFLRTDYSLYGILMIYWFYALRFNKILMGLFEAYTNMDMLGGIQGFATFSLIPIFMYNGEKGCDKYKWWFYAYYPLHLLVISVIHIAL